MIYIGIVLAVLMVLIVIAILGARADFYDAELYKYPVDGAAHGFDRVTSKQVDSSAM